MGDDGGFQTITKKTAKRPAGAAAPGIRATLPTTPEGTDPRIEKQHQNYIKNFRVNVCDRFAGKTCPQHKPYTCFNYHYDSQRRRPPFVDASESTLRYLPVMCPQKDNCPRGDACDKAHTHEELSFHPEVYKTKMGCDRNGGHVRCGLQNCSHAHTKEELRSVAAARPIEPSLSLELGTYKTQQCSYTNCTREFFQRDCIYWHSDRDRRRDLRTHWYAADRCPRAFELMDIHTVCSDDCAMSHNFIEVSFHPSNYKTKECRLYVEGNCPRGSMCAYYHDVSERREPAVTLGSFAPPKQIVLGDFVGGGMKDVQEDYDAGPLPYETGLSRQTSFHCEACKVRVNSARQYEEHVEGAKHKATVAKLKGPEERKAALASAQSSLTQSLFSASSARPSNASSVTSSSAVPPAQLLTTALAQNPSDPYVQVLMSRLHDAPVTAVAFVPDGSAFVTACGATARVWGSDGAPVISVLSCSTHIEALAMSRSGAYVACATTSGAVVVWQLKTGSKYRTIEAEVGGPALSVTFVGGSEDNLVVGYRDGTVRLFDMSSATARIIRSFGGHQGAVLSIAITTDGRTMATGSADGTVRLWDVLTGACSNELVHSEAEGSQPAEEVRCVAYSLDGHRLACACGSYAWIWLWEGGSIRTERYLESPDATVNAVGFNARCTALVTANSDGSVRLWSMEGDAIMSMTSTTASVTGASWSLPDGRLVTCAADGTCRLYWPREFVNQRKEAAANASVPTSASQSTAPSPVLHAAAPLAMPATVAPPQRAQQPPAQPQAAPVSQAQPAAAVPPSPALPSVAESTPLLSAANAPTASAQAAAMEDEPFWGDGHKSTAAPSSSAPAPAAAAPAKPRDALKTKVVCQICFRAFMHKPTQVLVEQDATNPSQCRQCKVPWKPVKVTQTLKGRWCDARQRPDVEADYRLCVHVQSGKANSCHRGNACSFAHSAEELEIWNRDRDILKNLRNDQRLQQMQAVQGPPAHAPVQQAPPPSAPAQPQVQQQQQQLQAAPAPQPVATPTPTPSAQTALSSGTQSPAVAVNAGAPAQQVDGVLFIDFSDLARPKAGLRVFSADGGPLDATIADARTVKWVLEASNKGPATERLENIFVNAPEGTDFAVASVEFSDPSLNFDDPDSVLTLAPGAWCRATITCSAPSAPCRRAVWVVFEFAQAAAPSLFIGAQVSVDYNPVNLTSVPPATLSAPPSATLPAKSLWDSVTSPLMSSGGAFSSIAPPLSSMGSLWDAVDPQPAKPSQAVGGLVGRGAASGATEIALVVEQLRHAIAMSKRAHADELRPDTPQEVVEGHRAQIALLEQMLVSVGHVAQLQRDYAEQCTRMSRLDRAGMSSSQAPSRAPPGLAQGSLGTQLNFGPTSGGFGFSLGGGLGGGLGNGLGLYGQSF